MHDQAMALESKMLSKASFRTDDPRFGRVFVRGKGPWLWDTQGASYIDFTCGYSASNFGHCFPPLIDAATTQLGVLTHLTQEPHLGRGQLAQEMIRFFDLPGNWRVHFNATGSRAIETAWKIAYSHRPGRLISLSPGYHGRSLATAAISETRTAIEGFVDDRWTIRMPADVYPYCANCVFGLKYPHCALRCQRTLLDTIHSEADSISAIVVEPAIGARGYLFPPEAYWQELRRITQSYGIIMIADEIQVGLGRCGAKLLSENQGWQADLIVLGKSLGGGIVPISAVLGRDELLDRLPAGTESETFACTPLSAAVAIEVLHQLDRGPWIARGQAIGQQLRNWVASIPESLPAFRGLQVDGIGAVATLEFLHCHAWKSECTSPHNLAWRVAHACANHGLLVHFTGPMQSRIVMLPPLTIENDALAEGHSRLLSAIHACL